MFDCFIPSGFPFLHVAQALKSYVPDAPRNYKIRVDVPWKYQAMCQSDPCQKKKKKVRLVVEQLRRLCLEQQLQIQDTLTFCCNGIMVSAMVWSKI